MKRTDAQSIGDIIDGMMAQTGITDEYARQRLCYLWAEVVGSGINRFTSRRYVEGDVLHVHITSAALKNEISFLRPQLVKRLNDAVGETVISDIMIH